MADGPVAEASRKRRADSAGATGSDTAPAQRPSKRRRMGQASVLCMRELFRAVIRDGDVTKAQRIALQNMAVLLSQVHGETWVSFPDTQGELRSFTGTRHQRQQLRDFLEKVAAEMQAVETTLEAESQDSGDCLRLAAVPWAGGITERDLLGCCEPEVPLEGSGQGGWLPRVLRLLPSKFMIKARAHELFNYRCNCFPQHTESAAEDESAGRSLGEVGALDPGAASEGARGYGCLQFVLSSFSGAIAAVWRFVRAALLSPVRYGMAFVGSWLVTAAGLIFSLAGARFQALCSGRDPFWSAVRFFGVAFLLQHVVRFLKFVVLMAHIRVLLCLAHCYPSWFGKAFFPFVFVARKFLKWKEDHLLLGCACSEKISLLSYVPVRATDLLAASFQAAVGVLSHVPFLSSACEPLKAVVDDYGLPLVGFVLDLTFSFGFAHALSLLVKRAVEGADMKLMLMSWSVSRMLREPAPHQQPERATGSDPEPPAGPGAPLHAAVPSEMQRPSAAPAAPPLQPRAGTGGQPSVVPPPPPPAGNGSADAPRDAPVAEASRKRRAADEAAPAMGSDTAPAQRPSKRRRMGQASVLCMRELFRAVIRDGDISDAERIGLQNAAVLLSQVHGETWVHFPDAQGELVEIAGSRRQLQKLKEFLQKVAKELQVVETTLEAEAHESGDCMQLVAVPWAGDITARELQDCCEPEVPLEYSGQNDWLYNILSLLPSKYMIKARAHELVNHYYVQTVSLKAEGAQPRRSLIQKLSESSPFVAQAASAAHGVCANLLRPILSRVCIFFLKVWSALCVFCLMPARHGMAYVGKLFVLAASSFLCAVGLVSKRLSSGQDHVWPAIQFFCVAFLHEHVMRLFSFIVLMARFRVLLCLAHCYPAYFGKVLVPFVFVAEKLLKWKEDHWLFGCACARNMSILSYVPVFATDLLVSSLLTAVHLLGFVPLLSLACEPLKSAVDGYARPLVMFVLDLTLSFGIAEGLALLAKSAARGANPRLMLMSWNLSRRLRDGAPRHPDPARGEATARSPRAAPAPPRAAPEGPGPGASPGEPVPEWREDGAFSLFD